MKKVLLLAVAAVVFACSPKQEGYTITGSITGEEIGEAQVFLTNFSRAESIKDTATLVNGTFNFEGVVTTPEVYAITVEGIDGRLSLFLDNSDIVIEASKNDFANATVTGGVSNDLFKELNSEKQAIQDSYNLQALMNEFYNQEVSQERKEEIIATYQEAEQKLKEMDEEFFQANPLSFYTLTQLIQKVEEMPIEDMEARIAQFEAEPQFNGNRYLAEVKEAVNTLKDLEVGMVAPQFTLNDPDGNPVSLESVYSQHKITMLDFWAGWCGPCRNFNPHLVELYKKYNEHGFGIIGISLDNDENLWKSAIEEDNLTWVQVSDLRGWNSSAAKQYYVRYIPQNAFVDSEGKIIERKVDNDSLEEFLKEQLGL